MGDDFETLWRADFPYCPPLSHLFKHRLKHLWFRIHSLPESKRYAENERETEEILRRQSIVFNDLIGENESCLIVCSTDNSDPADFYRADFPELAELLMHRIEPIPLQSIEQDSDPEEFFQLAFGRHCVSFDNLKPIWSAAADWKIAHLFVWNPNSKRIFAPYDGGVDLIAENPSKRDEFKHRYRDWLSSHPQGF